MSYTFLLDIDNGDIFINSSGKSLLIQGLDKLKQDIPESTLTLYDEDRNYGNRIQPGGYIGDDSYSNETYIEIGIRDSLDRLVSFQKKDLYLTEDEEIASIDNVRADEINNTDYSFFIEVTNGTGASVAGNVSGGTNNA